MKPHVLIVDDEIFNTKLLEVILEKDYQTTSVSNGRACLEVMRSEKPDIVLLDVMMPEMDGYEVLQERSEDESINSIPVIMITAKVAIEDVKQAIELGASNYIKKPVDSIELKTKVYHALSIGKQQKKIERLKEEADNSLIDLHDAIVHAHRIQSSIMPGKDEMHRLYEDYFILNMPRNIVSGDFYWNSVKDGKKLIAAVDCTGHGVPGAMLSMLGHSLLNEIVNHHNILKPSEILEKLRDGICENLNRSNDTYTFYDGMDIVFCSIDKLAGKLEYSGAFRPLYIVRKGRDEISINGGIETAILEKDDFYLFEIKGDKYSVGLEALSESFTNHEIDFKTGDTIYLTSDGYANQIGGERKRRLSRKKTREYILSNHTSGLRFVKTTLYNKFVEWRGHEEQSDDVLVIGIQL